MLSSFTCWMLCSLVEAEFNCMGSRSWDEAGSIGAEPEVDSLGSEGTTVLLGVISDKVVSGSLETCWNAAKAG